MLNESDTAEMIAQDNLHLWLGPKRAVLAYPASGRDLYNIAITAIDGGNGKVDKWDD